MCLWSYICKSPQYNSSTSTHAWHAAWLPLHKGGDCRRTTHDCRQCEVLFKNRITVLCRHKCTAEEPLKTCWIALTAPLSCVTFNFACVYILPVCVHNCSSCKTTPNPPSRAVVEEHITHKHILPLFGKVLCRFPWPEASRGPVPHEQHSSIDVNKLVWHCSYSSSSYIGLWAYWAHSAN